MADILPGIVTPTADTDIRHVTAGALVQDGFVLRRDSDGRYVGAQADNAATATIVGISLVTSRGAQPVDYAASGNIDFDLAVLTVGTVYVLSATGVGGIAPWADLVSTNLVTVLGVAITTTRMRLKINNSGAIIA